MGFPTIINQSDKEQQERWLQSGENREYLATYAQTELGHGKLITANSCEKNQTKKDALGTITIRLLKIHPSPKNFEFLSARLCWDTLYV